MLCCLNLMNILAVVPPQPITSAEILPPLQLAYIAAILQREGFKVNIIDAYALGLSDNEALQQIIQVNPDLLIFNLYDYYAKGFFTPLINTAKNVLGCCIIGLWPIRGLDGQMTAEEIIRASNIDFIIRGEPEFTVLELVSRLEKHLDLNRVQGVTIKEPQRITHTSDRPLITNLDDLPFPARSLLPNHKYRGLFIKDWPFTSLRGVKGCPNKCIFCSVPLIQGQHHRYRSVEGIVDELEWIVSRNGINEVQFKDPNFTFNPERCQRICREIVSRGIDIQWSCLSRVDTVNKATLQYMKKAGCYLVHFGVESGDRIVLHNTRKGVTLSQVKDAFHIAKSCDLETHAYFMIGNLGESKRSIEQTRRMCEELQPDFASFPVTIPLYGTAFYDIFEKKSESVYSISYSDILEESWRAYRDFYTSRHFIGTTLRKVIKHPSRMKSLLELYRGYKRLQKSHPRSTKLHSLFLTTQTSRDIILRVR